MFCAMGGRGPIPNKSVPMLHRRDCSTGPSKNWPSLTHPSTPTWLREHIIAQLWEFEVEAVATGTARQTWFCPYCMCRETSRGEGSLIGDGAATTE